MRESSASIRSISGSGTERAVLDDAPSLGDACRKQSGFSSLAFPFSFSPSFAKQSKSPGSSWVWVQMHSLPQQRCV